ncbi:MAG: NUDIX hydrolase [Tissierellia bacterium]|nr:NUDIX hydrolase [Tissierellia bacterium]
MDYTEKTIKSDKIYEGKILNLRVETVELPDRKYSKREIVEHGEVVVVIAVKDEKVILIKHYRKPFDKVFIEVPAGMIEANETPLDAAKREFLEETGMEATTMEYITEACTSPGYTTEKMYFFYTDSFQKIKESVDDESLEVIELTLNEMKDRIESLDIKDLKTILSYYLLRNRI